MRMLKLSVTVGKVESACLLQNHCFRRNCSKWKKIKARKGGSSLTAVDYISSLRFRKDGTCIACENQIGQVGDVRIGVDTDVVGLNSKQSCKGTGIATARLVTSTNAHCYRCSGFAGCWAVFASSASLGVSIRNQQLSSRMNHLEEWGKEHSPSHTGPDHSTRQWWYSPNRL